jgi:Carboxypeptidase regulatory-like domain
MSIVLRGIAKTALRFVGFPRESSATCLLLGVLLLPARLYAADVGDVRGVVHDSQHIPIAQAQVALRAAASEWMQTVTTDSRGEFSFMTVPLGDYVLIVTHADFAATSQLVTVTSGASPIAHIQLAKGPALAPIRRPW